MKPERLELGKDEQGKGELNEGPFKKGETSGIVSSETPKNKNVPELPQGRGRQ